MNSQVKKNMMTEPIKVYAKGNTDSMGDREELSPKTFYGYVVETIQTVINREGKEELSNIQIYLDGSDGLKIDPNAEVSCLTHIKQRIIKRSTYYKKRGEPDVTVLYLP